jgi:hypothetical protein
MRLALASGLIACASASPALAQYESGVSATVEAASEERRRGLSWSDGEPVLRGSISMPVAKGLSIEGATTSLWGSDRHGDADAVIDLGAVFARQFGGWSLSAEGRYHLFPGASGPGYGEIGAGAAFLIGPGSVDLSANYAPKQSAIGGENLYLSASAVVRAARLRPNGAYWDHGFNIDYLKGRWSAGLRYADSSIDGPGSHHAGATLIGRVGFNL